MWKSQLYRNLFLSAKTIKELLNQTDLINFFFLLVQVVYKNNDIRLELSRLARIVDPKMKIQGEVSYKCENVATLDPISFETPEAYISLPKWNTKRMGSISFDFRTTEPNGLILFTHGKPQERKDAARSQKNTKVRPSNMINV